MEHFLYLPILLAITDETGELGMDTECKTELLIKCCLYICNLTCSNSASAYAISRRFDVYRIYILGRSFSKK